MEKIKYIANILANSMEYWEENEFLEYLEDSGIANAQEIYDNFWEIEPSERDNPLFDFEMWLIDNVEFI